MTREYFEMQLRESLGYGFIHNTKYQDNIYSPKLVMNDPATGETVLTELQNQLEQCKSFFFNVAFITEAGIAMLKSYLYDLALAGVKGRLLISPYLDFNEPSALYELLKLKNVDVRMTDQTQDMHAKVYLFNHQEEQVVLVGSSNLTHTALKLNYEWNVKLTSSENGHLIKQTTSKLEDLWQKSSVLTTELIEKYKKGRKQVIQLKTNSLIDDEEISDLTYLKPNKMQQTAIKSLAQLREEGAERALVISATGTGKTYLSAFDVKQYQPDKFLFIVHREQILQQAQQSFQRVIEFDNDESCIYRSGIDISNKTYVFATIQTLSRDDNLKQLAKDEFDYILIDEVHRAGASTYQKVVTYFKPEFFLGMTATPERTDDYNIYELFDYNIAYEIRLQDALEEDMLAPFIYYGVSDLIADDGALIEDETDFSDLVTDSRVHHILEKVNYYSLSNQETKGLMFCSRNDEAKELSKQLNKHGLRTVALSGADKQEIREATVKELEAGKLDYILTVDIFNEGVDIPAINQIVMLRHTESSIIFIQQLGRGLRKYPKKEFVTIIDFIGNYQNNYQIPMALFGDYSYNKDNYNRDLVNRNQLDGITTINFEKVAREQIYKSIKSATFSQLAVLKKNYQQLKNKIGRIPFLMDFIRYQSLDPHVIFEHNRMNNYSELVQYVEKDITYYSSKTYLGKVLSFISNELMNGKRVHELILLKELFIHDGELTKVQYVKALKAAGASSDETVIESVHRVISLNFFVKASWKKYGETIVHIEKDVYRLTDELMEALEDEWYMTFIKDVLEVGFYKAQNYPAGYQSELELGQKYTRKDVSRILCFEKDGSATLFGYALRDDTVPIFVNYHKTERTNAEIKYEDKFLSENFFQWFTKKNRTLDSKLESRLINHREEGLKLPLFVKKDDFEDDKESYYLGLVDVVPGSAEQTKIDGSNIVKMLFKLRHSVPYGLYQYLVNA